MMDPRGVRACRLREALGGIELDSFLVTSLPNIRWLTGFSGSAAVVVVGPERLTLITDFRYASQAPAEVGNAADVVIAPSSVWQAVDQALRSSAAGVFGFEGHLATVREASRLERMTPVVAVPVFELIEGLRQVKDDTEIEAIRDAAAVAHAALAEVLPTVRAGEREIDVAGRLELALRLRGSEWHPFETIVASGPRSALPHARTSERVVERGEILLIDFGARIRGYCSDITRTVVVGRADARQREIYGIVAAAQLQARTAVRAGMTGREADALARHPIAAAGHGAAFGHSLGHGLGLEVHEAPRLAATAEGVLPVGAVVTVEPGIYLPGWGGVRIEDDVWLAHDGPVLLTDGATDLMELDN